MIRDAGYDDLKVEPRLSTTNQRRADIFYVDRSGHQHIHYYTDDVVCHPLCNTHIAAEALDHCSTLKKVEAAKTAAYSRVLDLVRSSPAVTSGMRVISYNTCSYTALGALGSGTVKCLNAAASFVKKRAVAALRARDDGLTPQRLAGMFRFRARCVIQAAILRGNGLIAADVGL